MKVSIITATYNSSIYIVDCIGSTYNQTYNNIEHIIIDGGSEDNTIEIIKSQPNRVTKIISEPDGGIYDAMNKGIMLANGDIIGILNSDDLYIKNDIIEKIVEEFKNNPILDGIYTDLVYVRPYDINKIVRYWKTGEFKKGSFKKGWHPAHPTLFLKKSVYQRYGLFDLQFNLAADFDLMLRLFERYSINTKYLPIVSVKMRLGGATNKSIVNIVQGNIECLQSFKNNSLQTPLLYFIYRLFPKLFQFFK